MNGMKRIGGKDGHKLYLFIIVHLYKQRSLTITDPFSSHGRPSPASKIWCHTAIKQHSREDSDACCTAKVTDNHHKSVMNAASSPSPVFQPESDLTRHPSTSSASVDSLIDSSHQPLLDASRDTLGSSASSEAHPDVEVAMLIECELGSCVDVVIDDEQKAVASPVRLTRTRIAIAAGVVGLGGYLCWRLLKK